MARNLSFLLAFYFTKEYQKSFLRVERKIKPKLY